MPSRRPTRADPQAWSGVHAASTGEVELVGDPQRPDGWTVLVNGVPSSYVALDDPGLLLFEYMQWMAVVLDAREPAGGPLRVAHLGGAGCTMARYLAAGRPGSVQQVFEVDGTVVTMARQAFGLRGVDGVRIRTMDGLAGLRALPDASVDVVIRDAFAPDVVPEHLSTLTYYREVARVLAPGGIHLANAAGDATVRAVRPDAAAALAVFGDVALLGEPGQLRGRRRGNVVVLASTVPIVADPVVRGLASGAVRARYLPRDEVARLVAGVSPLP